MTDPRIACLAAAAEDAACAWKPFKGAIVGIADNRRQVQVTIEICGPIPATENGIAANAYLDIEDLDELLRDLLAARADLCKLMKGTA